MKLNWKWLGLLLVLVGLLHYVVLFYGFSNWAAPQGAQESIELMQTRAITLPPPEDVPEIEPAPVKPPAPRALAKPSKASSQPPVESFPSEQASSHPDPQSQVLPPDAGAQDSGSLTPEQTAANQAPSELEAPPVLPNRAPSSSLLEYVVEATVKGLTYKGYGDLSWKSSGQEYDAYLRFYLDFGIMQTEFLRWMSQGRFDAYGLAPRRFAERRKGKSERAAHFVAAEHKIVFSNNSPDAPLVPGTQDRMSVIIQLVALAAGSPGDLMPGKRFKLVSVGTSNASELSARVVGAESVDTHFASVEAVKLVANASGKYEDDIEVWLAPEYQFLPVKIRILRPSGDVAEMVLQKKPKAI